MSHLTPLDSPLPSNLDVVVVGGGVGGLVAAIRLAEAGRTVAVLDRGDQLGGRARTHEQGEFRFNLGPHAVYRGGPAWAELTRCGVSLAGARPNPAGAALLGGEVHVLPVDAPSMLRTTLFGGAAKWEATRVLLAAMRAGFSSGLDDVSFATWLDERVTEPAVRGLFEALARVSTYCNAPDLIAAGTALRQLRRAAWPGVQYLHEGWATIPAALAARAAEVGVLVRAHAAVSEIALGPESTVALRRSPRPGDPTELRCRAVLVAGAPETVRTLVGPAAYAAAVGDEDSGTAIEAACLDLALSRLPSATARFALGIDRPLYFAIPSETSRLCAEGAAVVQVAHYLAPGDATEAGELRRELEAVTDQMLPGWREALVQARFLPRLRVAHRIPEAVRGGAPGRPGPEVSGFPSLFVAGDWVGPEGHLLDAVVASSVAAAERIVAAAAADAPRAEAG